MTFGYYFSPCGIKLATGWNGLESSWLKGFFKKKPGKKLKRIGVYQAIDLFPW